MQKSTPQKMVAPACLFGRGIITIRLFARFLEYQSYRKVAVAHPNWREGMLRLVALLCSPHNNKHFYNCGQVSGEEDFTYCCDRHDACYSVCGISKHLCEKDFLSRFADQILPHILCIYTFYTKHAPDKKDSFVDSVFQKYGTLEKL